MTGRGTDQQGKHRAGWRGGFSEENGAEKNGGLRAA
jgi:hypothetical protein